MKSSKLILIVLGALVLVAVVMLVTKKRPADQEAATPPAAEQETVATPGGPEAEPEMADETPAAEPVVTEEDRARAGDSTALPVEIRRDQVIATVNGANVTGKDLMLIGEEFRETPQPMSRQMYDRLLMAAVEREIVEQAIRAESITLSDDQKAQVENVRQTVEARLNDPASGNIQYNGTVDEQIAFEQRELRDQMLFGNLLSMRGVPPPVLDASDEQLMAFYKEHESEFGALPDDPEERAEHLKEMDFKIRRRYAFAVAGVYDQERRKLLDELKAKADIKFTGPK